jgi:hypothetical protein
LLEPLLVLGACIVDVAHRPELERLRQLFELPGPFLGAARKQHRCHAAPRVRTNFQGDGRLRGRAHEHRTLTPAGRRARHDATAHIQHREVELAHLLGGQDERVEAAAFIHHGGDARGQTRVERSGETPDFLPA